MSVRVMAEVWALDLPDSQKIVLLALADCANDEGHCWPSMATLTTKCSKGERTIQGVIKQLVEIGHLTRNEVVGKGCNYMVHPRSGCAPQKLHPRSEQRKPPQGLRDTPAAAADKPSKNHKEPSKDAYASNARAKPKRIGMTEDWSPSDLTGDVGDMLAEWPPGKLESELADFREYWIEDGTKRPGWDRTFRSRIRTIHARVMRESHDRQPRNSAGKPTTREIGENLVQSIISKSRSGGTDSLPCLGPPGRHVGG